MIGIQLAVEAGALTGVTGTRPVLVDENEKAIGITVVTDLNDLLGVALNSRPSSSTSGDCGSRTT